MDISATSAYLESIELSENRPELSSQSTLQELEFEFPVISHLTITFNCLCYPVYSNSIVWWNIDFQAASCNVCNGYYGPNFGEPVCLTCHAFLFPDYAATYPLSFINSEKTDDSDSGNDEPSDLNYSDKRLNISQNNIPFWLLERV